MAQATEKQIIETVEQELIYFNYEWEIEKDETESYKNINIKLLREPTSIAIGEIIEACNKIRTCFLIGIVDEKITLQFTIEK